MIRPVSWSRRRWLVGVGLLGLITCLATLAWWERARDDWPIRQFITQKIASPVRFSPDGRTLTISGPGQIHLDHDLATGRETERPADATLLVATTRDGRHHLGRRFLPDGTGEILWIDARTRAEERRLTALPTLFYTQLAPDDQSILMFAGTYVSATEVRTWDPATGAETRRPLGKPPGLIQIGGIEWLPSPDGKLLVYFDRMRDGLQLWDVATDRPLGPPLSDKRASMTNLDACKFTPDGRFLLNGRADGQLYVWDVARRTLDRVIRLHPNGTIPGYLVISPDGRTVASTAIRPATSRMAWTLSLIQSYLIPASQWNSSRETVLADLATSQPLARAPGEVEAVFSPDGRSIALRAYNQITIRAVPPPKRKP